MIKIKITNEEKYANVFDINTSQLSHSRGSFFGSITIETENDRYVWTGEHGTSDYEQDYGFILETDNEQ